jgi:hypothetical protein
LLPFKDQLFFFSAIWHIRKKKGLHLVWTDVEKTQLFFGQDEKVLNTSWAPRFKNFCFHLFPGKGQVIRLARVWKCEWMWVHSLDVPRDLTDLLVHQAGKAIRRKVPAECDQFWKIGRCTGRAGLPDGLFPNPKSQFG